MNRLGIKERKANKKDKRFFVNLMAKTIMPLIQEFYECNRKIIADRFDQSYKGTIILTKGKIRIGFYQLNPKGKTLDITRIFISPRYQDKGIGTYYLKRFEALGYKKIELRVWENNPAQRLYKRLGYKRVGKSRHKIHMEKVL